MGNNILAHMRVLGSVPVITTEKVEDAVRVAQALCESGLPLAEIPFRGQSARAIIARIQEVLPEMIIGAGAVVSVQQVNDAIEAGAKFIVSPVLNPVLVRYCTQVGIKILPTCETSADRTYAMSLGLDMVKDISNKIVGLREEEPLELASSFADEALKEMLGFELAHIGLNTQDHQEAHHVAKGFRELLGYGLCEGNRSFFVGKDIEVMKRPALGTKGHIAYRTNYLQRAITYLEKRGIIFDETTSRFDEMGNMVSIYLKEEVAGFAIHLMQANTM